jgi:hypothetical protein
MMSPATAQKVNSVVIFGDPDNPKPVQGVDASRTKVICHQGDLICQGQDLVLEPHLTYGQNAQEAATFVQQVAGS